MAELFGSADLIGRLKGMVEDLETKAELAQTQADQALAASLRETILTLLGARGVVCSDDVRARLQACADPPTLQRWLLRAASASTADEALATEDTAARGG